MVRGFGRGRDVVRNLMRGTRRWCREGVVIESVRLGIRTGMRLVRGDRLRELVVVMAVRWLRKSAELSK
jgi:hypothetical protein